MNYPVIIFSEGAVKLVNKKSNLNGSIDWSHVNYNKDDILIDSECCIYRFLADDDEDNVVAILKGSNILPSSLSTNDRATIADKLNHAISDSQTSTSEKVMCKKILDKINRS